MRTKKEIEEEIGKAVAKYHREQQGHEPENVRTVLVEDIVFVRSDGIFTGTEQSLLASEEGEKLVKSARRELRSLTRRVIEAEVAKILNTRVLRSYWDLDVRVGEQLEAYVLEHAVRIRRPQV